MTALLEAETTARPQASYLERLLSLGGAVEDEFTGTADSYQLLVDRPAPWQVISDQDTAAQTLFLLTLDTERRFQLARIAAAHGWTPPAEQPWDTFVLTHASV